jgi:hypothetical protein
MTDSLNTRYLVYRFDAHGTMVLMTSGLPTQKMAANFVKNIRVDQECEHRQTYVWMAYEIGTLHEVLVREGILQ